MLIKRKSLIVAFVSSFVIALVLVVTLVGYFFYLEFKADEFRKNYQALLEKAKARVYSRYIEIKDLDARIENAGALKGKPVIEGVVTNKGPRDIANLALQVNFLDKDNTVLYEVVLHPQEPTIGSQGFANVAIPYLYTPPKFALKPNEPLRFKKIMTNCPTEVFVELREGDRPKKIFGRWSGKLTAQPFSLDF